MLPNGHPSGKNYAFGLACLARTHLDCRIFRPNQSDLRTLIQLQLINAYCKNVLRSISNAQILDILGHLL